LNSDISSGYGVDDDDDEVGGTQSGTQTQTRTPNEEEKNVMIGKFVRLALFSDTKKKPIRRDDINKHIITKSFRKKGFFDKLYNDTQEKLKEIFGYEMVPVTSSPPDKSATKMWILRLCEIGDSEETELYLDLLRTNSEKKKMGLLLAIISFIFSNGLFLNEAILWELLKKLDVEKKNQENPEFENIEQMIEKLVTEQYLIKTKKKYDEILEVVYTIGYRTKVESNIKYLIEYFSKLVGISINDKMLKELNIEEDQPSLSQVPNQVTENIVLDTE